MSKVIHRMPYEIGDSGAPLIRVPPGQVLQRSVAVRNPGPFDHVHGAALSDRAGACLDWWLVSLVFPPALSHRDLTVVRLFFLLVAACRTISNGYRERWTAMASKETARLPQGPANAEQCGWCQVGR